MSKRIRYTPQGGDHVLYFYTARFDGQRWRVQQHPDWPTEHTEDNGSLLAFDQIGMAIHITWLSEKPAPGSPERLAGQVAILSDIHSRLSPEDQRAMNQLQLGIGHAHGAKVFWHKPDEPTH